MIEVTLVLAIVLTAVLGVVRPLLEPGALNIGTGSTFGEVPSVDATLDPGKVHIETDPALPSLDDLGELAMESN